jgi:L-threonylcarbamoyladenylate synthase
MRTVVLPAQDPKAIVWALAILQDGGLVSFPTDTVYGLAALAYNPAAVRRIYEAKDRPAEKAIPVLIADATDLVKVTLEVSQAAARLAACFWPGPLTLVVSKRLDIPEIVSATSTVGVRVPDHPLARRLLRVGGPMAVTSANLSGQPSPTTAQEVFAQLGGRIELIMDGGKTPGGIPSTVVECVREEPEILREGPVTKDQIKSCLSGLF